MYINFNLFVILQIYINCLITHFTTWCSQYVSKLPATTELKLNTYFVSFLALNKYSLVPRIGQSGDEVTSVQVSLASRLGTRLGASLETYAVRWQSTVTAWVCR